MAAEASAAVSLVKECVNLWFQYRNGAFSGEIRCRQFDMAKRQLQIMQACTTTSRSEGCEEGSVAHLLLWKVKEATNDLEDVVFKVIWLEEAWGMTGRSINQLKNIIHKLFLSRMEHSGIRAEMLGIAAKYSEIMLLQAAPTSDRFNVDAGSTSSNQRRRSETMQTSPPVSDHPILGLEENIGTLVANLKSEGCTSRVVCVWGEGGSGKSTLAGEIFKHDEVEGHFESFAWLSPPEHSEGIDIFGEILFRLDGTKSDNMKQEEVEEKLYEVLKQRKCLVVLNNIWSFSTETCGFLNKAFKEDHNSRSKLLLTTRKRNVAQQVDEDCFVIKPSYLDRDNSLELIKACLRKSGTGATFSLCPSVSLILLFLF
ncbi:NB-ARC domain containing protein [Parasponia andersonii]|uniref:NB-ARC domain containing protein n=1 Tax=Parasponia andersonii TaxID=3476 RepID=A0A2P5CS11_PARAD|nr:NB-ARC domain containing protein [Parasponia andersonii]